MSFGAMQGLVFGAILYQTKIANNTANRILAVLLILLSYRLVVQILRLFGLGNYDLWYYFTLDLSWVHGALVYFYVLAQINPDFKIGKAHLWHFVPLALQICFSAFVRIQNIYWDGSKDSLSWLGYWGYWLWMNQPTIYIVASSLIIYYALKSEKLLNSQPPQLNLDAERLKWLMRIITTFKFYFILVFIILMGDMIFFKATTDDSYFYFIRFYYYPFFIGISVLTYWIGMEGFSRRKELITKPKPQMSEQKKAQLTELAESLNVLMNKQHIYLDPELNLHKTAEHLNVKPYLVTQCLNEILNVKFNDYVNSYRIQEVKRLLKQPNKKKHNLLTIAFEAGFNSKSSFNRSIKNQLGIHPRDLK